MHGPNTPDGCPGCTFASDSFNGVEPHLNAHDVTFVLASRSPLQTLNACKQRMGWSLPWVSSGDSDFDRDLRAWTEKDPRDGTGYNFATPAAAGVDAALDMELMALSVFAPEDDVVYHTYTCYDRGTDVLNGNVAAAGRHAEAAATRAGSRVGRAARTSTEPEPGLAHATR